MVKKFMNTTAFILIIGFMGAWECGNYDFKVLLSNTGITLTVLFLFHFLRASALLIKSVRKIKHVKIS